MPKQFLFLYPISDYFQTLIGWEISGFKEYTLRRVSDIVDKRYRQERFDVNWGFFAGKKANVPDISIGQKGINIRHSDRKLSSGVRYNVHAGNTVHPNPSYILDQLPPHTTLVVAGFHQWNCVDKVASASYKRGINVYVDEDITDTGINRILMMRDVPVIRRNQTLESVFSPVMGGPLRESFLSAREGKPWLLQPSSGQPGYS